MIPLKTDYAGLANAMSRYDPMDEILYFFDTETGDVLEIDSPQEGERWFEFRGQRLRERVDEWLRGRGILPDEEEQIPEAPSDSEVPGSQEVILLNFSHPLTPEQLARVEELSGQGVERVIEAPAQFDHARPFAEQVIALADQAGLSPAEWQMSPLLVVPPSLNFIAVALLAELHGRCGYFPAHLRLRPAGGSGPTRYEVAEVMNLQTIREAARLRRRDEPSD